MHAVGLKHRLCQADRGWQLRLLVWLSRRGVASAQVLIPHRDDLKVQSVAVSLNYLAVFERVNGLQAGAHRHLYTGAP
jgi:hypothetical protein